MSVLASLRVARNFPNGKFASRLARGASRRDRPALKPSTQTSPRHTLLVLRRKSRRSEGGWWRGEQRRYGFDGVKRRTTFDRDVPARCGSYRRSAGALERRYQLERAGASARFAALRGPPAPATPFGHAKTRNCFETVLKYLDKYKATLSRQNFPAVAV